MAGTAHKLDAVDAGHDDIGDQQIDRVLGDIGERRVAVRQVVHLVPGPPQSVGEENANIFVVLNEEDTSHDRSAWFAPRRFGTNT